MAVTYTFSTQSGSIPLAQLDANFATPITIGNTSVQLGNTITTLNNITLANTTISSGNVTLTNVSVTTANVTTANITNAVIGTANVTTANITSGVIATANITTGNVGTLTLTNALGTASGGTGLSSFTSSGVVYASSSSALTTGSALTFDGTTLGVGANIALGSTGRYIYQTGAANLQLQVDTGQFVWAASNGSTEQMRLTSTGLGIGTSSPGQKLHVAGNIRTTNSLIEDSGTNVNFGTIAAGYLAFLSGSGAERMRLDASGNLLLGTTTNYNSAGFAKTVSLYDASSVNISLTNASRQYQIGVTGTNFGVYDGTGSAWRLYLDSSGNLGIGTTSPSASAILDAQSTTKGVRMPNMTTTQKNAISSPAAGLMVFDTTLSKLCVYTGAAWQTITSI
jgi:hypothetical protein